MKNITRFRKQSKLNLIRFAQNQYIITNNLGRLFRSYDSNICFIPTDENIIYIGKDYKYSRTTMKYLNKFLNIYSITEVDAMLENGRAILIEDL